MCAEIKQEANFAGKVDQIAVQNNYQGLTPNQAMDMLLKMFNDYYPQLKEEILSKLREELLQALSDIPPENIRPAPLRIAIDTMYNASITEEDELRKLYTKLLASSMNTAMNSKVHPGFCDIIRQLSSDEAKIMKYIAEQDTIPVLSLCYSSSEGTTEPVIVNFSDAGDLTGCDYPLNISSYLDNLARLGLIRISDILPGMINALTDKEIYEPLKKHKFIRSAAEKLTLRGEKDKYPEEVEGYASITDYGRGFCSVCIGGISTHEHSATINRENYLSTSDVATDDETTEMLTEVFGKN